MSGTSASADPKPLVTVGLLSFNGERFIRETLDSLLAQDYPRLEVLISDNASEDRTGEICRQYAAKYPHIRYSCNETNVGALKNWEQVMRKATGKYFMWAADHDLWHPSCISKCVEILEREPNVILCYGQTMLLAADGTELGIMSDRIDTRGLRPVERFKQMLWFLGLCNMLYGVFRTEILQEIPPFIHMLNEDDLMLTDLSLRGEYAQILEPLYLRRKNREDEDAETRKKRSLHDLNPNDDVRPSKTLAELHRECAREYIRRIWRAPLSSSEKILLTAHILCAFASKWEAWGAVVARLVRTSRRIKRRLGLGLLPNPNRGTLEPALADSIPLS